MSKQLTPVTPSEAAAQNTEEGGGGGRAEAKSTHGRGIGGREEAKCNKVSNANRLLVFFQPRLVRKAER